MEKSNQPRYYIPSIKAVRLLLIACVIIFTFGSNWRGGDISTIVFSFAFPALYIISGFLVLRDSPNIEKRILRAIKRTAICFVILLAVYLGLSLLLEPEVTLPAIKSKAFWINLFLLNVWTKLPIGSTIWYVLSMLYAYIFIYVLCKLKLLKIDIYIASVCLVISAVVGEFSGVVGMPGYIAGSFITRALPYILIGCFMQRKASFFVRIRSKHHFFIAAGGLFLSFAEYFLLGFFNKRVYVGHLIGTTFVAVAVCLFAFSQEQTKHTSKLLTSLSRAELSIPFYVCSPVYYFYVEFIKQSDFLSTYAGGLAGIIILAISLAVLYIYYLIRPFFLMLKYHNMVKHNK